MILYTVINIYIYIYDNLYTVQKFRSLKVKYLNSSNIYNVYNI